MGIENFLNVPYKMASSDNFEAYLEAMGVSEDVRQLIASASPTITLCEDGGTYTATTTSPIRNHTITFTPGEEFEDEALDGRKFRSVVTIEGNRMTHIIKGDPGSIITSEFNDDKLVLNFDAGGVKAKRVFERA